MNEFVRYEYLAFAYGFAIDSAYYARDMSATVQRERLRRHDAFERGQLDPHGIYLIQSVDVAKLQNIQSTFSPATGIGVVDGFTVVAPEWFTQNGDYIGHRLHRPGDISHLDIMLDRDYLFATHGNGLIYLSGGWSEPEADGIWSVGEMSQISFYLKPTPASARVSLGLVPYLPAAYPRLELTVSVNRHESAHWIFERNKPFPATTLTIPTTWLAANGDNSIQIHFDRPRSPSEAGEGADARQIAIQLRSMQLQQL